MLNKVKLIKLDELTSAFARNSARHLCEKQSFLCTTAPTYILVKISVPVQTLITLIYVFKRRVTAIHSLTNYTLTISLLHVHLKHI